MSVRSEMRNQKKTSEVQIRTWFKRLQLGAEAQRGERSKDNPHRTSRRFRINGVRKTRTRHWFHGHHQRKLSLVTYRFRRDFYYKFLVAPTQAGTVGQ